MQAGKLVHTLPEYYSKRFCYKTGIAHPHNNTVWTESLLLAHNKKAGIPHPKDFMTPYNTEPRVSSSF